ncbi:gas vesicle protein GvpJ [Nonomuraea sp. bgisy101]|uniref:gas vesicle protein GvpJ n=1 Tax=unclassified Nonomuraea TaxID=2593643 RepID=UPI003D754EED
MTVQPAAGGGNRGSATSLADVIDSILDKGLVIDAYVSVSLIGIEILSIDARIVVASVDTYLRFAEATDRLDLTKSRKPGVPEMLEGVTQGQEMGEAEQLEQIEQVRSGDARGSLEAAGDRLRDFAGDREEAPRKARSRREEA